MLEVSLVGKSRLAQAVKKGFEPAWLLSRQRRFQKDEGEVRFSLQCFVNSLIRLRRLAEIAECRGEQCVWPVFAPLVKHPRVMSGSVS